LAKEIYDTEIFDKYLESRKRNLVGNIFNNVHPHTPHPTETTNLKKQMMKTNLDKEHGEKLILDKDEGKEKEKRAKERKDGIKQ